MLKAQGGRLDEGLPEAQAQVPLRAPASGQVAAIDALEVGRAALALGAGRMRKEDRIDPGAGIVIEAPVGGSVQAGDPLATVHARNPELVADVAPRLAAAWRLVDEPVRRPPHVYARVDAQRVTMASE